LTVNDNGASAFGITGVSGQGRRNGIAGHDNFSQRLRAGVMRR
jgi:hypothetical protein